MSRQPHGRAGFSMVETAVSTLLVGSLLVAATITAGASIRNQHHTVTLVRAASLADALMADILPKPYMDPDLTTSAIARETGELVNVKVNYDDVDDFHNWQEQPPQYSNGSAMANSSTWKRTVTVDWITIAGNGTISTSGSESKLKRIQVNVLWNGNLILTRQALVTNLE